MFWNTCLGVSEEREKWREEDTERKKKGLTTYNEINGRKVCLYLLINRKARRQHEITA